MHSLHYKNLPVALSFYCHQPTHNYSTRYATSSNYVLPHCTTNRGQNSIKFTGPKVWAEVPLYLKDVAFRKPFSKKLKEHILNLTFEELPIETSRPRRENDHTNLEELRILFETDDSDEVFEGFDIPLEIIFLSDDENDNFEGFGVSLSAN